MRFKIEEGQLVPMAVGETADVVVVTQNDAPDEVVTAIALAARQWADEERQQ